jgi:hypothetical protein
MRETRTSGSMSGEGKRSADLGATAPVLDSTEVTAAAAKAVIPNGVARDFASRAKRAKSSDGFIVRNAG